MKKYLKEIISIFIQILTYYILPLTAGPTDMMGLVVLIILITFVNSIILGILSNNRIKYIFPIIISIIFLPTIFIYYNSSAIVHSLWYLVISYVGIGIGTIIKIIINKISNRSN